MCQCLCAPRIQLFQYEERNSCLIYFEELVLFLKVNLYWINPQMAFHNASLVHFHYFQWKCACFLEVSLKMFQFSWLTDCLGKTECSKPSHQHTDHRVPNKVEQGYRWNFKPQTLWQTIYIVYIYILYISILQQMLV